MRKNMVAAFAVLAIVVLCIMTLCGCTGEKLGEKVGEASITIECKTILNNMDKVEKGLIEQGLIPSDGVILPECVVDVYQNDNVGTLLKRVCKQKKIHLDCVYEQVFNTYYVRAINHIYEMSVGGSSGWMYFLNGSEPSVGVSQTKLVGGEKIKIVYTCENGEDLR